MIILKNRLSLRWQNKHFNCLKTVLVLFFVSSYWPRKFRRKVSCTAETPCKAFKKSGECTKACNKRQNEGTILETLKEKIDGFDLGVYSEVELVAIPPFWHFQQLGKRTIHRTLARTTPWSCLYHRRVLMRWEWIFLITWKKEMSTFKITHTWRSLFTRSLQRASIRSALGWQRQRNMKIWRQS